MSSVAAAVLLAASFSTGAIDSAKVERTVAAHVNLHPGDHAIDNYSAEHMRAVDLDGDGVDEILFLLTARCVQVNFDCPNSLNVLAAIKPGDEPPAYLKLDADIQAAHRTGYVENASVEIPGEVKQIRVSDNRIDVTFNVKLDSPICKRSINRGSAPPCPAPGRYRWIYAWTPGKLMRAE